MRVQFITPRRRQNEDSAGLAIAIGAPTRDRRDHSSVGMASLAGGAFAAAVYLINFHGMTRFFPWFAEARNWASLLAHIIFGIVAANTCT
ncbi:hypothetical protein [Paraburkholderia sediminicola]|uniref:hypothetical protein n=1 Tax=Paraburkholderia sediminicola TaxID=458836 RepID=UPI0038B83D3E